jgi:hypothetical protein
MIFSFGGGSGPQLRPMERGDLGAVLRIISAHDKDDFEAAREELRDDFEGMFVLTERGTGGHSSWILQQAQGRRCPSRKTASGKG